MPPRKFITLVALATTFLLPIDALAKNLRDPSSFVQRGDQFRQQGRYRDAIDQYSKAIKLDKRNPLYYEYRADCQLALGNYKRAVSDAGKAINLNPRDPEAFSMRARGYEALKDYKREKDDLDRLIDLRPTGSSILLRGQTKMHLKQYASAIEDCNVAINMGLSRPELSQLYQLRSEAYKKLEKKREYEEELAKYNSLQ
jgi:tetratricopeptide (TPR) repeat protein